MKKLTVKNVATAITALVGENTDTEITEGITGADLVEWVNKKVEQADARAAKAAERKNTKKTEEQAPIIEEITRVLADGPMTTKEMKEASDMLGAMSSQKISAVIRSWGELHSKKVKGVNTYSLNPFEDDAE